MKAILLLSSGIDSPVAGYIMQNKGLELIAVHFNIKSSKTTKTLAKKIKIKKIYLVKHNIIFDSIKDCNKRFTCVLCKRFMYRIAAEIAKKENCKFIVTGENLAQVASQTLDNLAVLSSSVKIPILRPLLCYDKEETVKIAKKIKTYETSIQPSPSCKFVPKNPATKAKIELVEKEEERLDIKEIVKNSVESVETVKL